MTLPVHDRSKVSTLCILRTTLHTPTYNVFRRADIWFSKNPWSNRSHPIARVLHEASASGLSILLHVFVGGRTALRSNRVPFHFTLAYGLTRLFASQWKISFIAS
ncbi:hypothetical protein HGRIS_001619 [Hohenbuehelia grisea]|uniref:Uncharacterized protein n=1 Tax=Hohenbuehelia grisea TaxID=104357 RepID=A0ABR3JHY1_9AGAR